MADPQNFTPTSDLTQGAALPLRPRKLTLTPPPGAPQMDDERHFDLLMDRMGRDKKPGQQPDDEHSFDSMLNNYRKENYASKPVGEGIAAGATAERELFRKAFAASNGVSEWAGEFLSQTAPAAAATAMKKLAGGPGGGAGREPWKQLFTEEKEQFTPFSKEIPKEEYGPFGQKHFGALTALRHVGRDQSQMLTDPVNVALMLGMGPVAEAEPLLGLAANAYFTGQMGVGAAIGVGRSARQFSEGDYWGGAESLVNAAFSGAFALHGARHGLTPDAVRSVVAMRSMEGIAQKDFGKGFSELDKNQRGSVIGKVAEVYKNPKMQAIAREISTIEANKDLKAIKTYQDARAQGKVIGLPDRLQTLSEDQLQALGEVANERFGSEPVTIPPNTTPVGLDKVDDGNVRKMDDRQINQYLVDIQFLTPEKKALVQDKKYLLEREQVRRRIMAADKTAVQNGTNKDPEAAIGNQLEDELAAVRRESAGAVDELDKRHEEQQARLAEERSKADRSKETREAAKTAVEAHRAKKEEIKGQIEKLMAEAPVKRPSEAEPALLEGQPQTLDQAFDESVAAAKQELTADKRKQFEELIARRDKLRRELRDGLKAAADQVTKMREEAPKPPTDTRRFKLEELPTGELAGRFKREGEPVLIEGKPKEAYDVAFEEAKKELARDREVELRRTAARIRKFIQNLSETAKRGLDRQLQADEEEARQRGFRVVDRRGERPELEPPPVLKVSGGEAQAPPVRPPSEGSVPTATPPERVSGGARPERLLPHDWKQAVGRHLGGGGYANEPELEWAFSWADKNRNHLFTEQTAKEAADALNSLPIDTRSIIAKGQAGPSELKAAPKPVKKSLDRPPVAIPPEQVGATTKFRVTRGYPVEAKFTVVDESQLTASHDMALGVNPEFPAEVQPRARDRDSYEVQLQDIYSGLEPAQLGENVKAEHGAPVVGRDLVVESGNGRVIALRRLIRDGHENYDSYKDWLATNAEKFGLKKSTVEGIKNPVLVRLRTSEVADRGEFARDANEGDMQEMSDLEQAKIDSKGMTDEILSLLKPSDQGDLFNAQNQPFINAFSDKIVGKNKNKFTTGDGRLSKQGASRIKNAIFARAYPGAELALERMVESNDDNIKNAGNGMMIAAPKMVVLQGAIEDGRIGDLSLAPEIDRAVSKLAGLREEAAKAGKPAKSFIADWLKQSELPGMESEPIVKQLVRLFQQYARSPRAVADVLEGYADGAVLKGRLDQGSLLGEPMVVSKEGLLKSAIEERGEPQTDMFDQSGRLSLEPPPKAPEAPKEEEHETPPDLKAPEAGEQPAKEAVDAARDRFEEQIKAQAPSPAQRRQFLRFTVDGELEKLPFLEEQAKSEPTPENLQELANVRANIAASKAMLAEEERKPKAPPKATPEGKSRGAAPSKKLEPPPPKLYGGENKMVSRDRMDELRKKMKDRAKGGTLSAGVDPEAFSDLVEMGLFHLEAGARKFGDWAKVMLSDGGMEIKSKLTKIWDAMRAEAWKRAGTDPEMKKYVESITKGGEAGAPKAGREGNVPSEKRSGGRRTIEPPPGQGGPRGDVENGPGKAAGGAGTAAPKEKPVFTPSYESRPSTATPVVSDADWTRTKKRFRMPEGSPRPTAQLSPEIEAKLLPDTVPMANLALSSMVNNDAVILAAPTGEGKTYIASAVVADLLKRMGDRAETAQTLFVVPRAVYDKWKDVGSSYGLNMQDYPKGETIPPGAGNYVITYEQATGKPGIEAHRFDIVVADESHYARKWNESKRGGMLGELTNNAGKALFTSATPFHTEIEMGYLKKLGLWKDGQFENWIRQFGGRLEKRGYVAGGDTRKLVALQESLIRDGRMVGRKRFLGGQHVNFAVVPLDADQKGQLRDAAKAFDLALNYYSSVKDSPAMRRAVLGNRVNFLKSFMERARIPAVIEMTKRLEGQGWKVAIFTESKSESAGPYDFMADADEHYGGEISRLWPKLPSVSGSLQEALGDNVAIFMGEASGARNRELEAFNTGSKKHLAATFAAGGVGVDMHDTSGDAPRASIFLGPPWSGILLDQGLGRIYRGGSKSEAMSVFLTSDAKPEFETLVGKVIPRMRSLRAIISGVREGDPVINGLQNSSAAIDYALGGERDAKADEFQEFLDTRGLHNYKEMPIPSAEQAKNKPRIVEDMSLEPPPEGPEGGEPKKPGGGDEGGGLVLYSGIDPVRAVREVGKLAKDIANAVKGEKADKTPFDAQTQKRLDDIFGGGAVKKAQEALTEPEDQQTFDTILTSDAQRRSADDPENRLGAGIASMRDNLERVELLDKLSKTSGVKGVSALWKTFMVTGRTQIKDLAGPVGEKMVHDIEFYHADGANTSGKFTARFYDIVHDSRLTNEEFGKVIDILQSRSASSDARLNNAANQMRKVFSDAWTLQRENGITIPVSTPEGVQFVHPTRPDPSYFPHIYDPEIYNPGSRHRETIIDNLMKKRGFDRAQAEEYINSADGRDVPLAGNIEKPRTLDVEGYRRDPAVLYQYASQLGEVVARAKVFGQYGEKLEGDYRQIVDEKARGAVKAIMGQLLERQPPDEGAQALNSFFSSWTALSKMTFSAIPVMSHSAKAAMLTNTRAYMRALVDVARDYSGARRAAMESGAIADSLREAALREYGVGRGTVGSKALSLVGFFKADKVGRVIGDATARKFMEKYALPELRKDNPDPYWNRIVKERFHVSDADISKAVQTGAWSKEALDRAGARLAQTVQGTYDPTELPPGWRVKGDTPAAQVGLSLVRQAFALKSYIWKNGVVLRDALYSEAMKGNLRPWIPFLVLFPVASEILEDLRQASRGNTERISELADMLGGNVTAGQAIQRYASDLGLMAGANYASSFIEASIRNIPMWQILAGPVLSDLANALEAGRATVEAIGDMITPPDEYHHKYDPMERIGRAIYGFGRKTFVAPRALMPPLKDVEGLNDISPNYTPGGSGASRSLEPPPNYPNF